MTLPTWEELKTQAIVEALEFYIYRMKQDNANQAAIDLYTKILKEVDPDSNYTRKVMKVHVIFTRGTDYEANEELYALYSHKEDAESEAEKLRQEVVTDRDYNYLGRVYEVVEVYELKVH